MSTAQASTRNLCKFREKRTSSCTYLLSLLFDDMQGLKNIFWRRTFRGYHYADSSSSTQEKRIRRHIGLIASPAANKAENTQTRSVYEWTTVMALVGCLFRDGKGNIHLYCTYIGCCGDIGGVGGHLLWPWRRRPTNERAEQRSPSMTLPTSEVIYNVLHTTRRRTAARKRTTHRRTADTQEPFENYIAFYLSLWTTCSSRFYLTRRHRPVNGRFSSRPSNNFMQSGLPSRTILDRTYSAQRFFHF